MPVTWSLGLNHGSPANALMQGFEYGQGQRRQLNTRNALAAYAADPSIANGNTLLVEGGPQLAGQAQAYTSQRVENQRGTDYRAFLTQYQAAKPGSPEAEAAYAGMVSADGPAAQAFRHNQFAEIQNKAKMADQGYDFVAERLANVTDEASYQQVLGEAEQIFAPMGIDVRKLVPPTYPGPEGVQRLLRSAMDAKGQLATSLQELRLNWDIQDDEADNARADRNTDDLIGYRRQRLDLTRRGQDMADERSRRPRPATARQPRAPTPSSVKGDIIAKYRRGETLTAREQAIMDGTAEGRGRGRGRGGGLPSFQTPEQVDAAKRAGRIKSGDRFRLPSGDIGTVP